MTRVEGESSWLIYATLERVGDGPPPRERPPSPPVVDEVVDEDDEPRDPIAPNLARLIELGLLEGTLGDASDALWRSERTHSFDAEAGVYPIPHADLARDLAALAVPALGDVVFEEQTLEPDGPRFAQCKLTARSSMGAWSTTFRAEGDYFNTWGVLGMLNSLAVEMEQDLRWVLLDHTADQIAQVMVGAAAALRAAVEEGALALQVHRPPARAAEMLRSLLIAKQRKVP